LKNVSDQIDRGAAQIHLVDAGGHAFGQAAPDSAVIVHWPLKMAAYETFCVHANLIREQKNGEHH